MNLALCLIFFLSGGSALIFETLWFRAAGLAFGNSVWASSLVLSSFMAGLALGSFLVARLSARVKRPLVVYATLEIAIGVSGLLLVLGMPALGPVLAPLFRPLLETWLMNPVRLASSFLLLLIPSTAMGATLPLLVRALSRRESNFGRVLGRLYGWNTLGAVAGALGAELTLIGSLGIRGAGLFAASLNGLAALLVWFLARRQASEGGAPSREIAVGSLFASGRSLLAAAFLSGAALLGLEVVWFRFMLLFRNTTSLVFALMLAVILAGIGAGGIAASWWLYLRPNDARHAPTVALGSGILVLFTYFGLTDSMGLLSAFPVSFASGVLFTLLGKSLEEEVKDGTRAAAALTLSNTLGGMTGVLVAGFLLLPFAGVERSFVALALAYGGVALLARGGGKRERVGGSRFPLYAAALAYLLCLALFPFGLMRNHYLPRVLAPYLEDGSRMIAMREGLTESAFYLEKDLFGEPRYHRLVTNGFAMSATVYRAKRYMRLFTYWPMALRPEAKRALLISYGVGVTAKSLTDQPGLESIDVVDISRDVIELSRAVDIFRGHHPLADPRVRLHIEDGRYFLQTTPDHFDLITAEPPPPKNAGIVNLYSQEYFALLHDRLSPGGLATYWLPVYQLRVPEAKAIVRAFCGAFDDCTLWTSAGTEWMLAGSRGLSGPVADEDFTRLWREQGESMRTVGVELPEQLGALFLGDAEFLRSWTGAAPPLVDNYPQRIQADFRERGDGSADLAVYLEMMDAATARERFRQSEWIHRVWPSELREKTLAYFDYQAIINRQLAGGGAEISDLHRVLTETSLQSLPLMLMASDEEDGPILEKAEAKGLSDPMLDFLLAARALSLRDYPSAATHLGKARALDPRSLELARYQVLALLLSGEWSQAAHVAEELRPKDARFWSWYTSVSARWPPSPATAGGGSGVSFTAREE